MGLADIFRASKIKAENEELRRRIEELHCDDYEQVKAKIAEMEEKSKKNIDEFTVEFNRLYSEITNYRSIVESQNRELDELNAQNEKVRKQVEAQSKKLQRIKELYKIIEYAIDTEDVRIPAAALEECEQTAPSVILKLHSMDIKDLRKVFRETEAMVNKVLEQYSLRYTTKTNQTIYQLMVIALRAEMQNILYDLRYEKLDAAIEKVKKMTSKYLAIAREGNQNIVGTLKRFVGEIEYLFISEAKIEYNYYVKKEQARQEQIAIRERMRQEAEDRKALEKERERVEKEEAKYNAEIVRLNEQMKDASEELIKQLKARILEIESLKAEVAIKKDKIANLQNGKAGNIYIISNLGSFGENVFKIGMTRRLTPQERIDELGSASVPFKFDVHSFIFSENAVELESKIHERLNEKRVNKVNRRKEFFYSTIDELEELTQSIDPNAEFTRTMVAEEFRQSQSSDEVYTDGYVDELEDDCE
ncbi:MAG: GIY-YIG nuclease family protein [Lachnospiraceae bacterium]|nr:GIY-YIG nuclease family protein [Lachnospiraceae bacterium]